jgi:hypothetical protein
LFLKTPKKVGFINLHLRNSPFGLFLIVFGYSEQINTYQSMLLFSLFKDQIDAIMANNIDSFKKYK